MSDILGTFVLRSENDNFEYRIGADGDLLIQITGEDGLIQLRNYANHHLDYSPEGDK